MDYDGEGIIGKEVLCTSSRRVAGFLYGQDVM